MLLTFSRVKGLADGFDPGKDVLGLVNCIVVVSHFLVHPDGKKLSFLALNSFR